MFYKTTLPNNLRLITIPQKNGLTATVLFLVAAGSKYETKKNSGVSHFLEHMCFKGTERRPTPMHIASELDAIGAEYNAFTGKEYTGYYAKAKNEDLNTVFDVLSDVYLHSIFHPEEIEREKGVIIEEINMYEDSPMRKVHDEFMYLLYGDRGAGRSIAGTKETVRALTRKAITTYRGAHYLPNATVIAVAGNVRPKRAEDMVRKAFASIKAGKKGVMPATVERQRAPQTRVLYKKTDQAHLIMGVRSINSKDPRRYAASLMANILGGWMSSRLFQRIRVAMGAAYYVRAYSDLYADHGYCAASCGVSLEKVENVIRAIAEEFGTLKTELVSDAELERAKGNVIGKLAIDLETSDDLALFYGAQEIVRKEVLSVKDIIENIRAVTPHDIRELACEIFIKERLNLAIIGPYRSDKKLASVLHATAQDL